MFRDLEAQVAIVTTNTKLQQDLHEVRTMAKVEFLKNKVLYEI